MRTRLLALLAACAPALVFAAEPPVQPQTASHKIVTYAITLSRVATGQVLWSQTVTAIDGEARPTSAMQSTPYRESVVAGVVKMGAVDQGVTARVVPHVFGPGGRVATELSFDYATLKGMRPLTVNGATIDLPSVQHVGISEVFMTSPSKPEMTISLDRLVLKVHVSVQS